MVVVAKKYVVLRPFEGVPKESDFKIEEETLRDIEDGEFLAEAVYMSVDPYQRMKLGNEYPCDMIGGQIAKVVESKHPEYAVGAWVMGHFGWRTHTVAAPAAAASCAQQPYVYPLPDFGDLPPSLGLGVLGRVGNTAYFGLTQLCRPRAGETVVVTGAAGAVGSHVGQIARILGCRVLGFAGSDAKCRWLQELGFTAAANYTTADVRDFLKQHAPDGVDCYFDNVGGEISSTIISQMNPFGRIAVCGSISSYNETNKENCKATILQPYIVSKQLSMEGFLVNRFASRTMEGIAQNLQWVRDGRLKYREHIWDGFHQAPQAFIGLFSGANTGKTIVKV
ncbi:unnamed protein product [Plutella xylostella]|uniref:Prostaglandin reductase 1 n=1 Tax=Plutella xylostella TaxID=51655 RepID=A0A8S4DPZ6_PLUXY|nr:unnamed protein product [Plutella xylostella]